MSTKMKGLIRGIRYIQTIFDDKEPEMQIGFPTDVKHVAHIGWDGPSANNPSWMNKFQSTQGLSNGDLNSLEEVDLSPQLPLEGLIEKPKHKSRRSSSATASPISSPARKSTDSGGRMSTDGSKHSRRQHNGNGESPLNSPLSPSAVTKSSSRHRSANVLTDSPNREITSTAGSRSTRRQQQSSGVDSPSRDQLAIPRHSRARKSKGQANNAPSRTPRSKDHNSSAGGRPLNDGGSSGFDSGQGNENLYEPAKLGFAKV